jgi:hypothetical protein
MLKMTTPYISDHDLILRAKAQRRREIRSKRFCKSCQTRKHINQFESEIDIFCINCNEAWAEKVEMGF